MGLQVIAILPKIRMNNAGKTTSRCLVVTSQSNVLNSQKEDGEPPHEENIPPLGNLHDVGSIVRRSEFEIANENSPETLVDVPLLFWFV